MKPEGGWCPRRGPLVLSSTSSLLLPLGWNFASYSTRPSQSASCSVSKTRRKKKVKIIAHGPSSSTWRRCPIKSVIITASYFSACAHHQIQRRADTLNEPRGGTGFFGLAFLYQQMLEIINKLLPKSQGARDLKTKWAAQERALLLTDQVRAVVTRIQLYDGHPNAVEGNVNRTRAIECENCPFLPSFRFLWCLFFSGQRNNNIE